MKIIDAFQARTGFSVLVINPEAGGTGLNITSANHVIHFNLPWNPAKEAQATARVYRPGQQSDKVFVYRFFYEQTIEEAINQRLLFKVELAQAALIETEITSNEEFVANALKITPLSR
jgi:SNF2 family DNA or RNA helicase